MSERNEWKEAVIEQLIVSCIYREEHENDPMMAILDLLSWECEIALDPRVSSEAAELRGQEVILTADTIVKVPEEFGAQYLLRAGDKVRIDLPDPERAQESSSLKEDGRMEDGTYGGFIGE
jgi:hypothetical protein